jgi:hypothetical protein
MKSPLPMTTPIENRHYVPISSIDREDTDHLYHIVIADGDG